MVWKTVVNSDAGTGTKHGGNDIDKIATAFNGNSVSDPIIFRTDFNTLRGATNVAGDTLVNNGTKYVQTAAREATAAFWPLLTRDNINTTYADLFMVSFGATITTPTILTTMVPELDIDFTGKTQVKLVFNYTRLRGGSGAGTHGLRVVDAVTPTNVLAENASITADGRTTVALTALPGWATGVQRIKVQAKADDATDDPIVHLLQVILK
jgi:hypothetical protein